MTQLCGLIGANMVVLDSPDLASVVLGTVAGFPTTSTIAQLFDDFLPGGSLTSANNVVIASIQESVAMNCQPATYVQNLSALAASDDSPFQPAASLVLGVFATKVACPFSDGPSLQAHDITSQLKTQTVDEERPEALLRAVYALANTRHPSVLNTVRNFTDHAAPAVRVAAMRAIANVATVSIYPD